MKENVMVKFNVLMIFLLLLLSVNGKPVEVSNPNYKLSKMVIANSRNEKNSDSDNNITKKRKIKMISKNEFREMNSFLESRGKYNVANKFKYVGKYQFGKLALLEIGYEEEWIDSLQNSIYYKLNSKGKKLWYFDISLFPPNEQEDAICKFYHVIESRYIKKEIDIFVGKKIDGVYITKAGLIGASMLGCGNVQKFLYSNGEINPKDGFGTSVKSRLKHFQNYELSACF